MRPSVDRAYLIDTRYFDTVPFPPVRWWHRLVCFLHGHQLEQNETKRAAYYCRRCLWLR